MATFLTECWEGRVTISSDTARKYSTAVGIAASCGFVTTKRGQKFGRVWLITPRGLRWLERNT